MWRRLKLLGRAWFRRVQVGVVLERLGSAAADGAPETIRAVSGASTVTLVGAPSELMLYARGRTSVAAIKLVGEPEAIEILNSADLRRESCSARRRDCGRERNTDAGGSGYAARSWELLAVRFFWSPPAQRSTEPNPRPVRPTDPASSAPPPSPSSSSPELTAPLLARPDARRSSRAGSCLRPRGA